MLSTTTHTKNRRTTTTFHGHHDRVFDAGKQLARHRSNRSRPTHLHKATQMVDGDSIGMTPVQSTDQGGQGGWDGAHDGGIGHGP